VVSLICLRFLISHPNDCAFSVPLMLPGALPTWRYPALLMVMIIHYLFSRAVAPAPRGLTWAHLVFFVVAKGVHMDFHGFVLIYIDLILFLLIHVHSC
jgi:hypothetical protein